MSSWVVTRMEWEIFFAKIFFLITFLGKNFHFHAQNFWWPFLVIDCIFSVFAMSLWSLLSQILYIAYHLSPFLYDKNLYFSWKNSVVTPFLLNSYFQASDNTRPTSPNIGGTNTLAVHPPQILGGRHPSTPLSLRPRLEVIVTIIITLWLIRFLRCVSFAVWRSWQFPVSWVICNHDLLFKDKRRHNSNKASCFYARVNKFFVYF